MAGLVGLTTRDRLGVVRCGVWSLLERAWELRHNLSTYDASYIALGEALGCGLLTADAGWQARAVSGAR